MKYFFFFVLALTIHSSFGQIQRAFITKDGNYSSDPKNAIAYVLITKLGGDSAYMVKQYDMRDTILGSGTYKDELLRIPNGKFLYYHKIQLPKQKNILQQILRNLPPVDTNNYIQLRGFYLNGKREGKWIFYTSKGVIGTEYNYENDKLNGPVTTYHKGDFAVREEGVMVNDSLEGKYYYYNADSLLIAESDFVNGRETNHILHYNMAKQSARFNDYMEKNLKNYHKVLSTAAPVVKFTISKTGSLMNPEIITGINREVDAAIVAALNNAPSFTPANYDYKPVEQKFTMPLLLFHAVYENPSTPFVQKIVRYRPAGLIPGYLNGGTVKAGVDYQQ